MANIAIARPLFDQKRIWIFLLDHIIELCLIVLIIALTLGANGFLTWANWMNIFRSNSLKGVISLGMTLTLIAGQVDLSIGSTVGLAGVIVAIMCRELVARGVDVNVACLLGITVCFAMAVAVGWMHGFFQHKMGMPAFIITLASKFALYGLAGILSGFPIANQFPDWFNQLGMGRLGGPNGIPIPAVVLILARRDPPPLDSPFARVLYLGRYEFLCNLQRLARDREWKAAGPIARDETVAVGGFWFIPATASGSRSPTTRSRPWCLAPARR